MPLTFRVFLAIDLPANIKKMVAKIILPLRKSKHLQTIKWTKIKNLHLTVCFLGDITNSQYQRINENLYTALKTIKPFDIQFIGLELFPSNKKPLAIILKPKPQTCLDKLEVLTKKEIASCEVATERRKFKPHVTIGRCKIPHKIAESTCKKIKLPTIHFQVTALKLFQSTLQTGGSVYTPIATYSLANKNK